MKLLAYTVQKPDLLSTLCFFLGAKCNMCRRQSVFHPKMHHSLNQRGGLEDVPATDGANAPTDLNAVREELQRRGEDGPNEP